jgi:hypothetical protein
MAVALRRAPALTHLCIVGACGTRPRRGPTVALPGVLCLAVRLGQQATRAGQRAGKVRSTEAQTNNRE